MFTLGKYGFSTPNANTFQFVQEWINPDGGTELPEMEDGRMLVGCYQMGYSDGCNDVELIVLEDKSDVCVFLLMCTNIGAEHYFQSWIPTACFEEEGEEEYFFVITFLGDDTFDQIYQNSRNQLDTLVR